MYNLHIHNKINHTQTVQPTCIISFWSLKLEVVLSIASTLAVRDPRVVSSYRCRFSILMRTRCSRSSNLRTRVALISPTIRVTISLRPEVNILAGLVVVDMTSVKGQLQLHIKQRYIKHEISSWEERIRGRINWWRWCRRSISRVQDSGPER